jgi:cell wall-associated NlpC family hydrolase
MKWMFPAAVRLLPLLVLAVAGGGCASTGATPSPFPRPGGTARPAAVDVDVVDPASVHSPLAATALLFQGVPYRHGGAAPSGFDCSGLVAYVFEQHGVILPRTTEEQFSAGRRVDARALEPGDLVFFSTVSRGPSHVGIAISPLAFVHAPSSSGVVRVERLAAPYWASRLLGARRIE